MKRWYPVLWIWLLGWTVAQAQLPDGTIAPNFTATAINGQSYTLYTLLDQGKTVYLDFFATWCGPCWGYHNSGALKDIWLDYGPPGTGEAFVFAIEGDAATNTACLYGPSGCVGGTQGNWVAGTPYPIIESATIANQYSISYYPTIYMVCPADRKVYEVGQQPASGLWNERSQKCPPLAVITTVNSVKNVKCFGSSTGSIDISATGGSGPYTYIWSNGATTQDLNNIPAGTYTCTVTNSTGWTGITDPITVENPSAPLQINIVEFNPAGCNNIPGSITVEGIGGWSGNYTYVWSNGQNGETALSLNPGNYTVSVTDDNLCTVSQLINMPPPTYPTASIAAPPTVTCAQPNVQLDATASSNGNGDFSYQWFASNGGNIVSGGTTLTPTVNAGGNYTLQVTNTSSTCVSYASTTVSANTTQPTANAGPVDTVSCYVPTAVLQGSGSTGSNFSYLWTASNGGNITSGASTLTPTVNAGGTYTLVVTNATNGCTKSSATAVTGYTTPPAVAITNGSLTCVVNTVTLNTTTNATAPTFAWTGPNNFTSSAQNPTVSAAGNYQVMVTDSLSGCTKLDTATVITNTAAPGASATGGTLTCVVGNVTITAATPDTTAAFAWTGPNGFASTQQNPSVSAAGAYNLVVTSATNGCTSAATATVALNNTPPAAAAATPGNLNCNNSQIQLSGAGSSQGNGFGYNWTTPDGNIVSGANTLTPIVNQAGTYNLAVIDSLNGCTATAGTSVVSSPAVTAAIGAQTNVACNGGATGAATVTPGGGNGTFIYAWSNGANTATAANLAAGAYSVSVTDGENCTATATVTISQPDPLAANATATAQTANGINDGTATANPGGGTANYTYLWSNNATTQTITGLAPGSYSVTVTDANSCTAVQTVTVNAFNCALSASISGVNLTCNGANNGSATVTLQGAGEPVTYAWSNGGNTPTQNNLAAGVYTVSVTDANNCPAELSVTIAEPLPLAANASATPESNAGANDGTATALPTGGAGTYSYLWSNNSTTQTITGLAPGTYTVTVTDVNGCTNAQTVVVNAFNCALGPQANITQPACFGQSNGAITVTLAGGTAPFTYAWSNGASTATVSNLAAGTYQVTITDANDCQAIESAVLTDPAAVSATAAVTAQPACPAEPTGVALASATGGTGAYSYAWSNGISTAEAANLTAGTYTVTVSDANGCTSTSTANIVSTDNVPPTVGLQNATLPLNANGSAAVTLTALNAQLGDNCAVASHSIEPASFNCSDLGQHTVTVTVTDQAGLTATATATVTVVDNMAPVLTCPNSMTVCSYNNTVTYNNPIAQDNCLGEGGEWNLESGLPSGSVFPAGVTTQLFTYTDASGNEGACSFEVIVLEPVNFSNILVTNDAGGLGNGAINITVTGGVGPYTYKWFHEGQVIATTEDLTGLTEGLYTVEVTDANGCVFLTENIEVRTVTNAVEPAWLSGIKLQPNPTAGMLRIVLNGVPAGMLEISVIDNTGRALLTTITENQQTETLDCSTLPQGLYIVRFRTGNEIGMRKLVISR